MLAPMDVEIQRNHILPVLSAAEKFNSLLVGFKIGLNKDIEAKFKSKV
jgi:hypothetical protein